MADLHIRIPDALWQKLKLQAEKNRRSLTAEAVVVIEKGVK
jgi:plasmid stability protein